MGIGSGRRAGHRAEGASEMWLVMKPRFRRDVRQGEGSGFHETNRPLNTEPQHELVRRDADGAAKEAGKVEGAHMSLSRERNQRHVLAEVCVNEVNDGAKLKRVQLASGSRRLWLRHTIMGEQMEHQPDGQRVGVQRTLGDIGREFRMKGSGVPRDDDVLDRTLGGEFDPIPRQSVSHDIGHEPGLKHDRDFIKGLQPAWRVELALGQEVALAGVDHAVAPSIAPVPSEGNRPRASVDANPVANDMVLRQFPWREVMPLHDDASPSQRDAAEQERARRRSRKAGARHRVNEHVFTGAVTVTIQGVATWLSGNSRAGWRISQVDNEGDPLRLAQLRWSGDDTLWAGRPD